MVSLDPLNLDRFLFVNQKSILSDESLTASLSSDTHRSVIRIPPSTQSRLPNFDVHADDAMRSIQSIQDVDQPPSSDHSTPVNALSLEEPSHRLNSSGIRARHASVSDNSSIHGDQPVAGASKGSGQRITFVKATIQQETKP